MNKATRLIIAMAVLAVSLIGIVGCSSDSESTVTATCEPTSTSVSADIPSPTVSAVTSETPLPTVRMIPSPTPWLDAFQQITQYPADDFWWNETETYLYYRSDRQLWRHDPKTGETVEATSETPIYGEPLPFVLSCISNDISRHNVYFAPSGTKALFAVLNYEYEDSTPGPDTDGEIYPSGVMSEIWYIDGEKPASHQIGVVSGVPAGASWDQNETRVLIQMGNELYFPTDSAGWLISLETEQMWNLFPVTPGETATSYLRPQMAPGGNKVLFTQCVRESNTTSQCTHYIRSWENGTYSDEVVSPPISGGFLILPNDKGLLIVDGIVLYLYEWEGETLLQLSDNRPPYTWGSVPMDPPRDIKFSRDLHYIAWNGSRGLQVFSLCPGGGELLDCE